MEKNSVEIIPCLIPINSGGGRKERGAECGSVWTPEEHKQEDVKVYGPHMDDTKSITTSILTSTHPEISISAIKTAGISIFPVNTPAKATKFPCTSCKKQFDFKNQLATHMKLHQRDSNFLDATTSEIKVPQIKNIQSLSSQYEITVRENTGPSIRITPSTPAVSELPSRHHHQHQNSSTNQLDRTLLSKVPAEVTISDIGSPEKRITRQNASRNTSAVPSLVPLTKQPSASPGTRDQDVVKNFNNGTNLQIIPQSVVGGLVELDELLKPYKCDMCDRAFRTQETLLAHKHQRHSSDMAKGVNMKYNCKPCRKSFTNRQEWHIHINSTSHKKQNEEAAASQDSDDDVLIIEEDPVGAKEEAPKSSKEVASASSLKAEKPFACALCGRRFRSPENLKHHEFAHLKEPSRKGKDQIFETVFSTPTPSDSYEVNGWKCPVCKIVIFKIEEYNTHMLLHYSNMPFKCHVCSEMFTTQAAREAHSAKCHLNGAIGSLTPHVTLHKVINPERASDRDDVDEMELNKMEEMANFPPNTDEVRPFECLVCKKRFREKKVFDYHTELHRGERLFNCHCGKYFRNVENLRLHEQSHQDKNLSVLMQQIPTGISVIPQPSRPPGMDLLVEGKRQLRLDEEDPVLKFMNSATDYGEMENLKCALCDEEQPNKIVLKQHELWHGRSGEFLCNICGKGFSSLVGIKIHKKKHINDSLAEQAGVEEKVFEGIKESDLFTEDEDSSDERRFSCRVCKKKFKSKQAIPYHMMVHTGETPFVCEICDRGFRSLASLKIHQKRHDNGFVDDGMDPMEHFEMEPPMVDYRSDEEMPPDISGLCSVEMMEPEVMIEESQEEAQISLSPPQQPAKRPYVSRKRPNDEITVNGVKFYVCHLCPKRFKSRAALTYHLATHERENKCTQCDMTFTSRMKLRRHFKARHADKRVPSVSNSLASSSGEGQENDDDNEQEKEGGEEEKNDKQLKEKEEEEEEEEEEPSFKCNVCSRAFRYNHSLVIHKKYNHPEVRLAELMQKQQSLQETQQQQSSENPESQESSSSLNLPPIPPHLNVYTSSSTGDDLTCNVCNRTLKSKAGYEYHMMTHTGEKPYTCQYCGKEFRSFNYYRVHENHHEKNLFKRPGRPRIHGVGKVLSNVKFVIEVNAQGMFDCKVCGKVFKSRQGLYYHLALHTKNKIFRCEQCNMTFRNHNRYQLHNMMNHKKKSENTGQDGNVDGEEKPFERKRGRPSLLVLEPDEPIEDNPDGGPPKPRIRKLPKDPDDIQKFQCTVCSGVFRSLQAGTYHMFIHTGERPFRCQKCNYGFRSKANLKKHRCGIFKPRPGRRSRYDTSGDYVGDSHQSQVFAWKTYADMMTLKCRKCEQKFKSRPALAYHCMIHTGEKPYVCTICDKKFRSHTNLNLHKKYHERDGHTDRETYERLMKEKVLEDIEKGKKKEEEDEFLALGQIPTCSICKKTFRTSGYMRQHQRRAHRMRFQNDKTPPYSLEGEDEFDLPEVRLEYVDGGYKCPDCDLTFNSKATLLYHSYGHSGAKPYKCRRCSSQYRSLSNLRYHEKTVHRINLKRGGRPRKRRRFHKSSPVKVQVEQTPEGDLKLFLSRIGGQQFKINKPESPENVSEVTNSSALNEPGNVFEDDGKSLLDLNLPKLPLDILNPLPLTDLPDSIATDLATLDFTAPPELDVLTSNFDDQPAAFVDSANLPDPSRAAELQQLTENLDQPGQDDVVMVTD